MELKYALLSPISLIFTFCCATNFHWFTFTNKLFPLKHYLNQNIIKTIHCLFNFMEKLFPIFSVCLLLFIILNFLSYINTSFKKFFSSVFEYIIMNIWFYYFIIRTIVFEDFSLPHLFSIGLHILSPNYYLFYCFSILTLLNYLFAPIHYRNLKKRNKKK